jgi:phosphinothricin acetyltransferase
MNEIVVRASTPEDMDEITRIYAHWVRNTTASFEIEPPGCDEMEHRRTEVLKLGLPYLCAKINGAVAGYAYAHAYRPRQAYRLTLEDSIYVDPEHAGRGCGRALLTALIAECERGPWQQMIAVIGGSDNKASIGLHEQLGFQMVGTLHAAGFKFDRWVDSVLMQRGLGARKTE